MQKVDGQIVYYIDTLWILKKISRNSNQSVKTTLRPYYVKVTSRLHDHKHHCTLRLFLIICSVCSIDQHHTFYSNKSIRYETNSISCHLLNAIIIYTKSYMSHAVVRQSNVTRKRPWYLYLLPVIHHPYSIMNSLSSYQKRLTLGLCLTCKKICKKSE